MKALSAAHRSAAKIADGLQLNHAFGFRRESSAAEGAARTADVAQTLTNQKIWNSLFQRTLPGCSMALA
jgi:hypothetical protein